MSALFTKNSHTILHGQVVSGITRQPVTLYVASGLAWITIEGMPDDHWLRSGDMLSIPADRLIVIESEESASRIEIRPAPIASNQAVARKLRAECIPTHDPLSVWQPRKVGAGQSGPRCQGGT